MSEEYRSITEADIARINELYRKSQTTEGLNDSEKEEQAALRKAYIAAVRRNLRGSLDTVDIINKDGSVSNLGETHGRK